jgi:hypothetical protein
MAIAAQGPCRPSFDAPLVAADSRGSSRRGPVGRRMPTALIAALCLTLGWVGSARASSEKACSDEPALRSQAGAAVRVLFDNTGVEPLFLYRLDAQGHRKSYGGIAGDNRIELETHAGDPWVVTDSSGRCKTIVEPGIASGPELIGLPGEGFRIEMIKGWRVKVRANLRASNPALEERALDLLRAELGAVSEAVHGERLAELRRVTFWLDERIGDRKAVDSVPVFHPNRDWLRSHGLNPDMAGGIELPNITAFLESYSWEPWAILHELSHFYHFSILGAENQEIHAAYAHARDAHLYESVRRYDGTWARAYALTNEEEYFAELTEAYFGRNDYFPFTRAQLEHYDPVGFAMVRKLWEEQ